MNFDDKAFAHMLKDYSVFSFPGLVMQFRSGLFRCCSLTGSNVLQSDRIITSVWWKQELCGSPV